MKPQSPGWVKKECRDNRWKVGVRHPYPRRHLKCTKLRTSGIRCDAPVHNQMRVAPELVVSGVEVRIVATCVIIKQHRRAPRLVCKQCLEGVIDLNHPLPLVQRLHPTYDTAWPGCRENAEGRASAIDGPEERHIFLLRHIPGKQLLRHQLFQESSIPTRSEFS